MYKFKEIPKVANGIIKMFFKELFCSSNSEEEKKMREEDKEKIIDALEGLNQFEVCYKFSDVFEIIKAKNQEEAEEIADKRLLDNKVGIEQNTSCYEIEVEEIE